MFPALPRRARWGLPAATLALVAGMVGWMGAGPAGGRAAAGGGHSAARGPAARQARAYPNPRAAPAPRHFFSAGWRPGMGGPAGLQYVGAHACVACHTSYRTQFHTGMGHASDLPAEAAILEHHSDLAVTIAADVYRLRAKGSGPKAPWVYSVSRGGKTVSVPVTWAFGLGAAGQTYLYERDGAYHESRVSYFNRVGGLATTMGYGPTPPGPLWDALGRRMAPDEARACFVCHTTGSYLGGQFQPQRATSGVTCEECHGPGSAHVAAMRAHDFAGGFHIFNPGQLDANDLVDFCGSCHRTTMTVLAMGVTGTLDVRFQPYRLTLSQCWNPTDRRIACLACHNPHEPLVTAPAAYDHACLACHVANGERVTAAIAHSHPGPACPVGTHDCVTCHMPKVHLPGSHDVFTDHDIRIVKAGAPYPG
ncbi:MAG: multiheme c-type cytochrome [Terriglobales bacterium]